MESGPLPEHGTAVGIPLWHMEREEVVRQIERAGYKCIIKAINNKILPRNLLGEVYRFRDCGGHKAYGADACGENGEYHTIAVGGPVFKRPLRYRTGQILDFGDHSVIDINVFLNICLAGKARKKLSIR